MTVNASDRELSPDDIVTPLAAFLAKAGMIFAGDLERAADHVHYPADPNTTLVGSVLGQAMWESAEGKQLISLLLTDPILNAWFGGQHVNLVELQAILASAIRSWAASNQSADEFSRHQAQNVLQALKRPDWPCWTIGVAYGVTAGQRLDLPRSYSIDPDVDRALSNAAANGAVTELHLARMNKGFGCLFLYGASADREMFGPFAATTAMAWGQVAFETLKKAIWLASGVSPVVGDVLVTDASSYPVVPLRHLPAPLQTYPVTPRPLDEGEVALLATCLLRIEFVREDGPEMDPETELQLRLALSHVDTILRLADRLVAALLVYVALEGLLLNADDDESRLGQRVAWLVGVDTGERRSLRRLMSAYRELRGNLAHGKRPRLQDLETMLGRKVSPDEVHAYFTWSGHETGELLKERCRELLRKVLLSFLTLVTNVESSEAVSVAATRRETIETLEAAIHRHEPARKLLEDNARALFA